MACERPGLPGEAARRATPRAEAEESSRRYASSVRITWTGALARPRGTIVTYRWRVVDRPARLRRCRGRRALSHAAGGRARHRGPLDAEARTRVGLPMRSSRVELDEGVYRFGRWVIDDDGRTSDPDTSRSRSLDPGRSGRIGGP